VIGSQSPQMVVDPPLYRHGKVAAAAVLAAALQALVFGLVFPHIGYPLHLFTDVGIDNHYAQALVGGEAAYRSFVPEYPPLAVWLISLPALHLAGKAVGFGVYQQRFAIEMFVLCLLCMGVVVAAAARLWPGKRARPLLAALSAATFVLAIGPLVENRFDIGVALITAIVLYALFRGWTGVAGLCVGLGFAFKVTPIVLLPLVLVITGWNRRALRALALCAAAAIAPFLPYLDSFSGIRGMFGYQLNRPLEIESVLGLPLVLTHLLFDVGLGRAVSHRSWYLVAPGAHVAATLSGPLTGVAFAAVIILLARGRRVLREVPQSLLLATVTIYLAFLCFAKVLSPQYMIWLMPAAVLLLFDDLLLGGLLLAATALTQVEFPALWYGVIHLREPNLAWLCARNIVLLASLACALWRLWRLPSLRYDAEPLYRSAQGAI
jgi:hypothetical protein